MWQCGTPTPPLPGAPSAAEDRKTVNRRPVVPVMGTRHVRRRAETRTRAEGRDGRWGRKEPAGERRGESREPKDERRERKQDRWSRGEEGG